MAIKTKTLDELKKIDSEFLVPTQIAGILGCDPYKINLQAHSDKSKLGFPVIIIGSRVKIPKIPFINFMTGKDVKT